TSFKEGAVSLTVGASEVVVGFQDASGVGLPVLPGGVPRVTEDGAITITGSGYAPATAVDVWLFSEPTLLGSTRTDANGSFSATYELPDDVTLGGHSIVAGGFDSTGAKLSLLLGVEVQSGANVLEFAH